MKSIVGIFNSFADAKRGAALLRTVGIDEDHIAVLSPHTPEAAVEVRIPTTETEQPGMGQALGGAIGAGLGVAGGVSAGGAAGRRRAARAGGRAGVGRCRAAGLCACRAARRPPRARPL